MSSVGSDKCGRGASFEVKLGRTESCSRGWENELLAYIFFHHQASNIVSFQ